MSAVVCVVDGKHLYPDGKLRRPNLTDEQKQEIRELYCKGQRLLAEYHRNYTIGAIGKEYNRSKNGIWIIVNGLNEVECERI